MGFVRGFQESTQPGPVEGRSRVGLTSGSNVGVPDEMSFGNGRIGPPESANQGRQAEILSRLVGHLVRAFQLDADGEVVATGSALEARQAGVPGPSMKGNELDDFAATPDKRVSRHLQPLNLAEERVYPGVQNVGEQVLDPRPAEFTRRQADAVNDNEINGAACGTVVRVGGWTTSGRLEQPGRGVDDHLTSAGRPN